MSQQRLRTPGLPPTLTSSCIPFPGAKHELLLGYATALIECSEETVHPSRFKKEKLDGWEILKRPQVIETRTFSRIGYSLISAKIQVNIHFFSLSEF